MRNPNRVIGEIELVSTHFGEVRFDPHNPKTVVIERFDLPAGFNQKHTRLLVDLGSSFPELPPQDFYLGRGLRRYGKTLSHYFENGFGVKEYCKNG